MSERSVAIVTGGSAGIGASSRRHLIAAGHEAVSLADSRPDGLNPVPHAIAVNLPEMRGAAEAAAGVAKKFADGVVMFFAAPENSFITGQVLYVRGGTSVASISF